MHDDQNFNALDRPTADLDPFGSGVTFPSALREDRAHNEVNELFERDLPGAGGELELAYDAYGRARHHWGHDVNGDGSVSTSGSGTDLSIITAIVIGGGATITDATYCAEADINRDGVINENDELALGSAKKARDPGEISDRSSTGPDSIIGWCGYVFVPETKFYHVRFRVYDTGLRRWKSRGPLGYVDGMGVYEYVRSLSMVYTDCRGYSSENETSQSLHRLDMHTHQPQIQAKSMEPREYHFSIGAGAYKKFGASVGIDVRFRQEACCVEGNPVPNGILKVTVDANIHVGLGFGGKCFGRSVQWRGTGVHFSMHAHCEFNECQPQRSRCCRACVSQGVDIGHEISVGTAFLSCKLHVGVTGTWQACWSFGPDCAHQGLSIGFCGETGISLKCRGLRFPLGYGKILPERVRLSGCIAIIGSSAELEASGEE